MTEVTPKSWKNRENWITRIFIPTRYISLKRKQRDDKIADKQTLSV